MRAGWFMESGSGSVQAMQVHEQAARCMLGSASASPHATMLSDQCRHTAVPHPAPLRPGSALTHPHPALRAAPQLLRAALGAPVHHNHHNPVGQQQDRST